MHNWHNSLESLKPLLAIVILLAAVYSFMREKLAPDVTALLVLIVLLLTTILTPAEAFAGFSHPATVSVAAVLVLSAAIERTGALSFVARYLLLPLGASEFWLTATVMFLTAMFSAFINNTAAVAVFIPLVLEVCRRTGISPGRVLMPMSHAATLGGLSTLIGTSTNLVAHEFARQQGLPGFSLFELGKVGVPIALIGGAYMLLIGRRFLPRTKATPTTGTTVATGYFTDEQQFLAEFIITEESKLLGKAWSHATLEIELDATVMGITRNGQNLVFEQETNLALASGDLLRIHGQLDHLIELDSRTGLALYRPASQRAEQHRLANPAARPINFLLPGQEAGSAETDSADPAASLRLAEVVVLTPSGLIGRTLRGARFAEKYGAVVLALQRRGRLTERPALTPLQAGDVLFLEGNADNLEELAKTRGFLVIRQRAGQPARPRRLWLTVFTLLGVITVAALGWLPIVTAAVAGCAVLMVGGALRPREAYQAIDLSLVFLLAGSLALGTALEKVGLTVALAQWLGDFSGGVGPYVVLISFFVVAMVISEFMSNSGTIALLGPLALSVAQEMGINQMTLLVAVTFGASAAFAMPIGYQTSLMIYGPGGYRISDFLKMGIGHRVGCDTGNLCHWVDPTFLAILAVVTKTVCPNLNSDAL